jgi:magnesium chelatase family protein
MIAQAHSATLLGIEALPIVVEMDLVWSPEMKFIMVGLPDKAVEESRERVQTAIRNCQLDFPKKKIICNLAPGDIRKEGP